MIQLSVAVRNAMLNAVESTIGTSAVVKLRTGPAPSSCATADSGVVLATMSLTSDWMANAANGSKAFNGLPITDVSADATGVLGHFRLYASNGTTCHMQGSITSPGGGGDMIVDFPSVRVGQTVSISSWSIDMSGAA